MMSSLSVARLARAVGQSCARASYIKKSHKALTAACIKLHNRNLSADANVEHIFRASIPDVEIPNKDVFNLLYSRSRSWGDKDAIECGLTGRKYTYNELMDASLRWGAALKKILPGLGTVAVMSPNCPEYPILLLGTVAVGGTVTTISPSYVKAEVARQLENADAEVIVVDASLESLVIGACEQLQKSLPILVLGTSSAGNPNIIELLTDKSAPLVEPKENPLDSIGFIPYSSGTTGLPKGVAISQGALAANLVCFTNPIVWPLKDASGGEQSTVIGVLPFYHIYGLHIITMMTLYSGGKIISLPTFTPQDYLRIIKDHKVDVLHLVPPILNFLVYHPSVTPDILTSVNSIFCGAAPVPAASAAKFKEKTKPDVIFQEGFGMTEVLGSHMTPVDDVRLGFCGKPIPNTEVKVVDIETGKSLPAGERGEMCIRGPQ
ncbi:unnamed protein product, partial [Meganyctiphanes norvegica]